MITTDVRAELRAVLDALPDAVLVINAEGTILDANAQVSRLLGSVGRELIGQHVETLVPERYRAAHVTHRAAYFIQPTRRDMGAGATLQILHQSGVELPVDIALAPFSPEVGGVLTLVSIRDARPRVAAARALHESEQRLFQAQKMEAIGRLAGGVAHDFNNIMGAILGTSALLLERLRIDDPMREDVVDIQTAGQRAAALTRQLLSFSRRQIVQPVPLDLNQVVREIERMLARIIGEDIELNVKLANDLHIVQLDRVQLEQVIVNLVVNARDAMPRGGKLTVETANLDLDASYASLHAEIAAGAYTMLAVTDSGSGIDEEMRQHLFEPFFTTKAGKGTGLGLATVYGIVKQAGGHVWVYSEVGRGATFKLYFPRSIAALPGPRVAEAPARGGSETILLVEDDSLVRKTTQAILESRGYRVLVCGDGPSALRRCDANAEPIELLLTDVVLPGMSGREVAACLRARRAKTRVLYMSGYTDDAVLAHGILEHGVSFIQKPFSPESLARKVRGVLDADS